MRFDDIVERMLPQLRRARVERVTVTGGEPLVQSRADGDLRSDRGRRDAGGDLHERHPDHQ